MTKETRPLVVILVHGTWAKEATWAQEKEALSNALERIEGVKIVRFNWSSWNRFTTRRKAAQELAEVIKEHRNADQFIIAHSHGGNIALASLKEDESLVKGVICLNTPFFTVLSRDNKFFLNYLFGIILLMPTFILFGLWISCNWHWLTLFAGGILNLPFIPLFIWFTDTWVPKHTAFLRKQLELPVLKNTPVLCLTTPDDEAFGWLGLLESISNIPRLLTAQWIIIVYISITSLLLIAGILPIIAVPWEPWLTSCEKPDNIFATYMLFFLSLNYYIYFSYLVCGIATMPFSLLLQGISQGTWMLPFAGVLHRIVISLVPVGSNSIEFFEKDVAGTGIKHSLLYKDPETIKFIIDWINRQRGV
ncbi:hypothetical protein AU255_12835 [Methyloprofundus sedimenti]|uniref:AB hydrolase-1 domain-containing protein n=1 Tax=Methyloprofundus sedimenti TaxID=1420851 RepID=A0A1V8M361_9GAMM|nr:alpha/beta hydrolase [Methyloprofundus sedimenti]OQK16001.1 hypothetical protein AU255_12835 [Methyloprofundus sedimenti]